MSSTTNFDLTNEAEGMVKRLEGVEAGYLFFAAYLHKGTEQRDRDINGTLEMATGQQR